MQSKLGGKKCRRRQNRSSTVAYHLCSDLELPAATAPNRGPTDQSVTDGGRPLVLWAVASQGHRRLLLGISPSGPELLVGDYGRADGGRHREAVGLMAGHPVRTWSGRVARVWQVPTQRAESTLPYTNTSPNECGNFRFMRKTHAGPPRHSARSVAAAIPGVDRDPLPRPGDAVYAGGVCYPHSDADQSLATALHLWQLDRHPGLRRGVVDVRKQRCTVSSGTPTPSGNRRSVSLLLRTRSLKG